MPKFVLPNLENATPGFIIDELATIRAKKNLLKKLEDVYKVALDARTEDDDWRDGPIIGDNFQAERESYPRHAVDQKAVKRLLEREDVIEALANINITVDEFFSDTMVTTLRTGPIPGNDIAKDVWGVEDEDIFKQWGMPDK